jgi:hypothetical protein
MTPKKLYALTVAKRSWTSERNLVVAHIPWDQFETAGGPEAYALIIEQWGATPVVVSRSAEGRWSSSTKIGREWAAICRATPLESLEWHTMSVEADHYPWELFGRPG